MIHLQSYTNLPKVFNIRGGHTSLGQHGFDPALTDMHATFFAWGPMFKHHKQIHGFENIHIYPLITETLGLNITQPVDGNISVLKPILKN